MPDVPSVTALILAAGAGTRRTDAAPFEKPLHRVNGSPLIYHALKFASEFGVDETVVVASPFNVKKVLREAGEAKVGIQESPTGVVDAIRVGMHGVRGDRVLLLMSDNTFDPDGSWFRSWCEVGPPPKIAVNSRPDAPARYSGVTKGGVLIERGSEAELWWVGPVFADAGSLRHAVSGSEGHSVEATLNRMGRFTLVRMRCADHGVAP